MSTCRRSTRGSPIWSRCSCTSATPTSSSARFASRAARSTRGSLLTDIAREFGYARARSGQGRGAAVGRRRRRHRGVRFRRRCRRRRTRRLPTIRSSSRTRSARCWSRRCSRRSPPIVRRKCERLFRIAGVDPAARSARRALSDALVKAIAQEASDVAGAVPQHLHPRHRLLPAGRHGARRVPARDHHRRRRPGARRQVGLPRSADAVVPAPPASFPTTCSS